MRRHLPALLGAFVAAVAADLGAKALAERVLWFHRPFEVAGEWFRLTLTYNKGVAFGLFATDGWGVIIVSDLAMLLLTVWVLYALHAEHYPLPLPVPWALGLLLGGGTANFLDRLGDGRVTDFIDFGLGARRFATFNLADVFIIVGVGLFFLRALRENRHAGGASGAEPAVEEPRRAEGAASQHPGRIEENEDAPAAGRLPGPRP